MKLLPPILTGVLRPLKDWNQRIANGIYEAAPAGAYLLFITGFVPEGWVEAGTSLPLEPYKELAAAIGETSDPFTVTDPGSPPAGFVWACKL